MFPIKWVQGDRSRLAVSQLVQRNYDTQKLQELVMIREADEFDWIHEIYVL